MLLLVESIDLFDHSGITGRSVFLTVVSQVTCMCERRWVSSFAGLVAQAADPEIPMRVSSSNHTKLK